MKSHHRNSPSMTLDHRHKKSSSLLSPIKARECSLNDSRIKAEISEETKHYKSLE